MVNVILEITTKLNIYILIGAIVYFLYIQKQAEYLLHHRSIMYQELVQVNGVYEHEQVNILSWWNVKI